MNRIGIIRYMRNLTHLNTYIPILLLCKTCHLPIFLQDPTDLALTEVRIRSKVRCKTKRPKNIANVSSRLDTLLERLLPLIDNPLNNRPEPTRTLIEKELVFGDTWRWTVEISGGSHGDDD